MSISRSHRRTEEQNRGHTEDELLSGTRTWQSDDGSRSRNASASESGGSIRVLKTEDRKKVITISEDTSEEDNDSNVYNDTRLGRTQPWRSRYPTPHDLKERLVRKANASIGEGDGAQD